MAFRKRKKTIWITAVLIACTALFVFSTHHATVDFNTEVKPILNKKCITCHGGIRQQGNLSFLFRSEALAKTKSGKYAIIPGNPDGSEMIRRIKLNDPEDRMPYHKEPLSDNEIQTLTRWIKQGAKWGDHWAYVPVKAVDIPKPKASLFGLLPATEWQWVKNDIDYFVFDKLQQQDLKPSPEADKATLLRRVSLDITGLPPSTSIAPQYLTSNS